jgi:hypothetical protein
MRAILPQHTSASQFISICQSKTVCLLIPRISPYNDSVSPSDPSQAENKPFLLKWGRRIVILFLIAAALVLLLPSYRQLKVWRARYVAGQAEKAAQAKQWSDVIKDSQLAYQLAATDPETLRRLGNLQEKISPRDALELYLSLAKLPGVQPEDLRHLARLALVLGEPGVAEAAIQNLLRAEPSNIDNLLLASNLSAVQKDLRQALLYARQAQWIDPQNRPVRYAIAQLLSLNPQTRDDAIRQILALAIPGTDSTSFEALQFLANSNVILTTEDVRRIANALEQHPLSQPAQKLLSLQLQLRLPGTNRTTLLEQAVRQYGDSDDNRLLLARWLNQQGEFQRTLNLVPAALALKSQSLFLVRLDAMAQLHQWQEIDTILTQNISIPLSDAYRELFRARCARELKQSAETEIHWQRAIREGQKDPDPNTLWFIADYALKLHERAQAWEVYQVLSKNPVTARQAYTRLVRMAEEEGATARLLEVIQRMRQDFPTDIGPDNDIDYLKLLLNRELQPTLASATKRFDSNPKLIPCRITLALARLRNNQPLEALKLFADPANLPTPDWLPGWQTVYVATLARNNRIPEAQKIAAVIPLNRLKPEELELIRGLIKKK